MKSRNPSAAFPALCLMSICMAVTSSCHTLSSGSLPSPGTSTSDVEYRPGKAALRAVTLHTPVVRRLVFYGNYGGPGQFGGEPIDQMDEYFRRHDLTYDEATARPTLFQSDRLLIQKLKEIPRDDLDHHARSFRRSATFFFQAPILTLIGKPMEVLLTSKEAEDASFHEAGTLESLYDAPLESGTKNRPRSIGMNRGPSEKVSD